MPSESFPSSAEVCIVGAGPSGLACALGLAARQIPFVIVDSLGEGHNGSRAILVNPSALESLGRLYPQVAADLIAAGTRAQAFHLLDRHDKTVFRIPLTEKLEPYTKYPFALVVAQHVAEQQMRAGLKRTGHEIHFNKRVTGVTEVAGGSQYELQFESGQLLTARYIVAADGSKSFLRSFAGISLIDPFTKTVSAPGLNDPSFVVADVLFDQPMTRLPRDALQIKLGQEGFVLTGPLLDGPNMFRIYIGLSGTPPRNPDIDYLQGILDARGPGSSTTPRDVPRIAKVLDSARFRTRNALAKRYVHAAPGGAYILLVGDAAHTHGPAGGQGMNMGICDGCEVAQAIHQHRSDLKGDILEEYSRRRRAAAHQVIQMVQKMSEVERGGVGWEQYWRVTVLCTLARMPFVRGFMAWNLSGLGHIKR